jgi:hypothetical protein
VGLVIVVRPSPRLTTAASAAAEPMVCMTLRWRGVDSNFQYAGAVNLGCRPFSRARLRDRDARCLDGGG